MVSLNLLCGIIAHYKITTSLHIKIYNLLQFIYNLNLYTFLRAMM